VGVADSAVSHDEVVRPPVAFEATTILWLTGRWATRFPAFPEARADSGHHPGSVQGRLECMVPLGPAQGLE